MRSTKTRTETIQVFKTAEVVQPDLVCLSHLAWDFVYQRPQHIMSRSRRAAGILRSRA
jgi:hypothetical protein